MIEMTDRELLELAAKAAGIDIDQKTFGEYQDTHGGMVIADGEHWNPLTNDGDALRLAVKLQLRVFPQDKYCYVESCPESLLGSPGVSEWEMCGTDPYAATRRAIVRAAAEIGKLME